MIWPSRGFLGRFRIFQGCSVFSQILTCRPPCASQFLTIISSSSSAHMLICTFFKFRKSQADILNCQIIKCCRVQYPLFIAVVAAPLVPVCGSYQRQYAPATNTGVMAAIRIVIRTLPSWLFQSAPRDFTCTYSTQPAL